MDSFWIPSTWQSSDGRGRNDRLKQGSTQSTRKPWVNWYVLSNIYALATHYSQLFDDLASWRGEIKKAASNTVRPFPFQGQQFFQGSNMQPRERNHHRTHQETSFAHGSKDEEVHVQFLSLPLDFIHYPWRTTQTILVTQWSVNCFMCFCMAMTIRLEIFEQQNLGILFRTGRYLLPSPR